MINNHNPKKWQTCQKMSNTMFSSCKKSRHTKCGCKHTLTITTLQQYVENSVKHHFLGVQNCYCTFKRLRLQTLTPLANFFTTPILLTISYRVCYRCDSQTFPSVDNCSYVWHNCISCGHARSYKDGTRWWSHYTLKLLDVQTSNSKEQMWKWKIFEHLKSPMIHSL